MDGPRAAAAAAALAALALAGAVVAPYLLLPPDVISGIGTYYAVGALGPRFLAVAALVVVVALVGGIRGQTPHGTVAGAALGVGFVMLVVAVQWAVAVPPELVASLSREEWLAVHRWVVVGLSAALVAAAGVYARLVV